MDAFADPRPGYPGVLVVGGALGELLQNRLRLLHRDAASGHLLVAAGVHIGLGLIDQIQAHRQFSLRRWGQLLELLESLRERGARFESLGDAPLQVVFEPGSAELGLALQGGGVSDVEERFVGPGVTGIVAQELLEVGTGLGIE